LPLNGLEGVSYAYGLNHYEVDRPLRDLMAVYTKLRNDLSPLGKYVGTEVYEVAYRVDAETVIALIAYALIGGPEERKAVRSGAWFVALAFLIFLIDVIGPYGLSSVYGGGPLLPFPYDLATVAAGAVILYVVAVLTAP